MASVEPSFVSRDSTAMSVVNPNRPQQLRRAVYVHVSDFTNAYNIDHPRLEEELTRVRIEQERESPTSESTSRSNSLGDVPKELDTSYPKKRLQPPRGGYNMVVLVGKIRVVVDKKRVDGSRVRLAEVEVGDETGTVSLRARDEQIDILTEISERSGAVVLRNCTLELFQGKHIRVAVTKWGKLTPYPDHIPSTPPPPSKINRERNFSLINLSIVATDLVQQMHMAQGDASSRPLEGDYGGSTARTGGGRGFNRQSSGGRGGGRRNNRQATTGSSNYRDNILGTYPSGTAMSHGYPIGVPQYYTAGPQATMSTTQVVSHSQMLHHHRQYEIQHRQIEQMYHGAASQTIGDQQTSIQPGSPMMIPGVQSPPSFEAFHTNTVGAPMPLHPITSSPYMLPISTVVPESPQLQKSRSQSPSTTGKMNPQAATFDPSLKSDRESTA